MKIKKVKVENSPTLFKDLRTGQVFQDPSMDAIGKEWIFMRTVTSQNSAVCLNDGETSAFGPLDQVKVLNAELVIEVTE